MQIRVRGSANAVEGARSRSQTGTCTIPADLAISKQSCSRHLRTERVIHEQAFMSSPWGLHTPTSLLSTGEWGPASFGYATPGSDCFCLGLRPSHMHHARGSIDVAKAVAQHDCKRLARQYEQHTHTAHPYAGNVSCALHSVEGALIAHAQGDSMDTIALRQVLRSGAPKIASCVLPTGRRVLQLAASGGACQTGHQRVLLARGLHWLQLLNVELPRGGRNAALNLAASITLNRRPLHACLNPHVAAEVVCLFEDGQLSILRLDRRSATVDNERVRGDGSDQPPFAATTTRRKGMIHQTRHAPSLCHVVTCRVPQPGLACAHMPACHALGTETAWGATEYTLHPRILYVATPMGAYRRDLRETLATSHVMDPTRTMRPLVGGALATPPRSACTPPLFALSSTEQLLLYDERSTNRPVQQWQLPRPTGVAVAGSNEPCTLPPPRHFFCQFDEASDAIHLLDRWSGQALSYPILSVSIGKFRECPKSCLSPGPTLTGTIDPSCALRRHLSLLEAATPNRVFPLAGAGFLRDWATTNHCRPRFRVPVVTVSGDIDVLLPRDAPRCTARGAAGSSRTGDESESTWSFKPSTEMQLSSSKVQHCRMLRSLDKVHSLRQSYKKKLGFLVSLIAEHIVAPPSTDLSRAKGAQRDRRGGGGELQSQQQRRPVRQQQLRPPPPPPPPPPTSPQQAFDTDLFPLTNHWRFWEMQLACSTCTGDHVAPSDDCGAEAGHA